MADLPRFEVIGDLPIRDSVTKRSVPRGGVVRLDPQRIIVAALQEAACIGPELGPAAEDEQV